MKPDTSPEPLALGEVNKPIQNSLKRLILLVVIPAGAALIGLLIYLNGGRYIETDNAYIKADKVPISAEVSGMISAVLVNENQTVDTGQLLFRLDPAPFEVAVAIADANLAQVRAELAALKASYHEKQAEIALAQNQYQFSIKQQTRQADLRQQEFVSVAQFDQAEQNTQLAKLQIAAQQQDLQRIAETLGGSADRPINTHPRYRAAYAALQQAQLNLSWSEVRAPVSGTLSKPPKPGQHLSAGVSALTLVANDIWVEANFTETDLTYVKPGQSVSISVDTYPDHQWRGTVDSLSPATGAEFSLLPAQNVTGNWVKIAQRIPVRIRLDNSAGAAVPQLRAGLSAITKIDTGHTRSLLGLSL